MNTMHELLNPDLIDLKIAERHAEAAAWRLAREASEATRSERGLEPSPACSSTCRASAKRATAPTKAI